MDGLTVYGAVAVAAMLVFYALERRGRQFVLAFAGACVASSVYGFLAGTWPFGVIEAVWQVWPSGGGLPPKTRPATAQARVP